MDELLKAIVRKIRTGENVAGYTLEDDILNGKEGTFKVQGIDRLRLIPITISQKEDRTKESTTGIQENAIQKPKKEPKEYVTEKTCSCGEKFPVTKFNQYLDKCPKCRRKPRRKSDSVDRVFVCPDCGKEFTISRYQPYYNPERCQKCNRKKHK